MFSIHLMPTFHCRDYYLRNAKKRGNIIRYSDAVSLSLYGILTQHSSRNRQWISYQPALLL